MGGSSVASWHRLASMGVRVIIPRHHIHDDWVQYRAQDWTARVGQAAVVLSARIGVWQRLQVRRR